jgi:glycosyltransferase involved in cell wall biosynthesis
MKLLVDATAIPADRGGIGRYVDALLPALVAEGIEVAVACQRRDCAPMSHLVLGADVIPAPREAARRPGRQAWEQSGLPLMVRGVRAEILHSPHYTLPRLAPVSVAVMLHDATFFSHPELYSSLKGRFFRHTIRVAARRADALVVPSAATGSQVRQYAGGAEWKFHVAHHGVDSRVFRPVDPAERQRVARAIGADGPYVAFLGTLEPRKNVPALVRA